MVIQIKITGLDKVYKLLQYTPDELDKEVLKKSEEFMRMLQKSIKLRAPRDTGFLASQINLYIKGKVITIDTGDAYYAYFQEFGFRPHFIPLEYFEQHYSSPATAGIPIYPTSGLMWVKKNKPFIYPAINATLPSLPNMMSNAVNTAIKNARRK
jgi:hypothetical protein